MRNKLLIASVALSGLMSAQSELKDLPYVRDVSTVQVKNGVKFVVTLAEYEWYDPSESNCIGDFNPSLKRDTIIVSSKYPKGHLIDETQWETGEAQIEGTEVPEWQKY